MSTVNEWLMERGFGDYIWAFATQGFEGRECLQELMSLDEAGLDRLAVQTLHWQNAVAEQHSVSLTTEPALVQRMFAIGNDE